MTITEKAVTRLHKLYKRSGKSEETAVFRVEGIIGSCRAAKPLLHIAAAPEPGDHVENFENLKIAIAPDCFKTLNQAKLDYEGGFLGRGLYLEGVKCEICES